MAIGTGDRKLDRCPTCGFLADETNMKLVELQDKNDALQAAAVGREATIRALKNQLIDKREAHEQREVVERLADYWNQKCRGGRARAPAAGARFDKTAARLAEGWTEEELMTAIDGAAKEPTTINGRTYDDLQTIMKSATSVESHVKRAPSLDDMLDQARDLLALLPADADVERGQTLLRIYVSDWLTERGFDGMVAAALGWES